MNWSEDELDALLTQDVDEVVHRARSLGRGYWMVALRDSLTRLETSTEPLDRLKVLLFIQTILAFAPDGRVQASIAESAAHDLAMVVFYDRT